VGTFTLQLEPVGASDQTSRSTGPLSAAHHEQLAAARDRAKPIRKAARVAAFNGWTTAGIAGLSLPFALFDRTGALLTLGLALIAYNEFRGRKRLLNFDPSAATLLGWNQLGLLAMIVVYSLWSMYGSFGEASALSAELKGYSELDGLLGNSGGLDGLFKQVSIAVYGGVIVLSAIFQGGNAWYYFTRRRRIDNFIAATPDWVRDVLRGTV
jgi:hypothetical protein